MEITNSILPDRSVLKNNEKFYDYIDCFESEFSDPHYTIGPQEITRLFFSSTPKWVGALFQIRNQIVRIFGLKVADKNNLTEELKFNPGDRIGLFNVFARNAEEVVIGEDDKHLNFRVSLFLLPKPNDSLKKILKISTVVSYNTIWGHFYFFHVKPFHKLIVPVMLKGIINQIK